MRIAFAMPVLCVIASCLPALAQTPATTPAAPSTLVQPALDAIYKTVGALKTEKWKGGSIRGEAVANITSIRHDLESSLPPLLQQADASPASASSLLPALRNMDALYDVALRVFEASRVAAPADQVSQLQTATEGLERARRAYTDRLQLVASAQDKQIVTLQTALKAQPVPVCPTPAPATPPEPEPKPAHKHRKPVPKPTPATPAQPNNAPPTKPQT